MLYRQRVSVEQDMKESKRDVRVPATKCLRSILRLTMLDVTEKQTRGENNVSRHAMQQMKTREWKERNGWKVMEENE
jgi:hypothetical protein